MILRDKMNKMIYEKKFVLRTNDFDELDQIKPSAILDFFQDVAGEHASILNIGYDELLEKNLIWILSRTKYEIKKMPNPYETIKVVTWPHPKGKVEFVREYEIYNKNGELIITGISIWCVIDINTRRIKRADVIDYPNECINKTNFQEDFKKTELPNLDNKITFTVFRSMLDHNMHVNNSKYADFIFDCLPTGTLIRKMQINYFHECILGDNIDVYFEKKGEEYLFEGIKNGEISFSGLVK